MSIKDLFDKGHSLKFLKNKTQDGIREDLESARYVEAYSKRRSRFFPDVNFATASNFARFGSAEEYYDSAIKRIYQTYPYDGSLAEKIEWENDSTYLDLFIFDNEYPRTNGFVTFNSSSHTYTSTNEGTAYSSSLPQYIYFTGGPHADPSGDYKSDLTAGSSRTGISKANIYDTDSQRTNNLEVDPAKGLTIEFWMKKDGWVYTSGTAKVEYIFNIAASDATGDDWESLRLFHYYGKKNEIGLRIESGGSATHIADHDTGLTDVADGKWHHYAVTFKDDVSKLYVDGVHVSSIKETYGGTAFTGKLVGAIGALAWRSARTDTTSTRGWGNAVSCSFDEFRYWKAERDAQQIGRFYRAQVGGGTNTDNVKYDDIANKVDLGVYYKFNEGVTGNSTTDATILDYSGRISNGTLENYEAECRSTNSAIVIAGAASKEFKDPIIYSTHPDVSALTEHRKSAAILYDHENTVSIYKSFPGWILEQDEKHSKHLKYLTQIIASYFDDLYLQIQKLSTLKDINYPDDNNYEKPLPFAERLLTSRGYDAPELFAHATALAKYLERDEKKLFEKKLYEIKNIIYQNIYNNLSYIQKSKGTFKSLRNFLRCFGIDEELVKLNIYANNDTYELKDNITNTAVRKKYIDFDDLETRYTSSGIYTDAYTATAYQYKDPNDSNSKSYIPGIANETFMSGASLTIEADAFFPKRAIKGDIAYQLFPGSRSSIFGMHAVEESNTDLTYADDDTINFNVMAVKSDNDQRNVTFSLRSTGDSPIISTIETGSYRGVYDNERWNLAFRLRPTNYPVASLASGSLDTRSTAYTYELYGVNYLSNILQDEFNITGSMSLANAAKFFTSPKRIFVGACRENFTGSVLIPSDVKVSSVRFWFDYLSDEELRAHGKDANIYGRKHPYRNTNFAASSAQLFSTYIPQMETLALHWSLEDVTGSDAAGQFLIPDASSGSASDIANSRYGWIGNVSKYNYSGRGDKFTADSKFADRAIDVEFVQTGKQKLPEVVNSDDMVKILSKQDDVVFTRDTTYVQHLISVEKSMYQTISEEMLRYFATITDFNNLIGEPVNRYRQNYKQMGKLRELFFEKVENQPDLENYIEYFKWVDSAVSVMIAQLIPASSNTVELLRNMVESHVLERNKYWTKFPTLEMKPYEPIASLKGIEELKYNWKFGHAPQNVTNGTTSEANQNTDQAKNCFWWKERADRDGVLTSGDSTIDTQKNKILKFAVTSVSGSEPMLQTTSGTKYRIGYYSNRSLARPYDFSPVAVNLELKGGGNPKNNKIHDFYKSSIAWGSDDDFIFLDVDNKAADHDCDDKLVPDIKNKKQFNINAYVMNAGTPAADFVPDYSDAKSGLILPFSMYSSSLDTGYRSQYPHDLEFANLHEDKYGSLAEIPMQGPFTEKYVGGQQHRHIGLNHLSRIRTGIKAIFTSDGPVVGRYAGLDFTLSDSANRTIKYSFQNTSTSNTGTNLETTAYAHLYINPNGEFSTAALDGKTLEITKVSGETHRMTISSAATSKDNLNLSNILSAASAATATITINGTTNIETGDIIELEATDGTFHKFTVGSQSPADATWAVSSGNVNTTATNLAATINNNSKFTASAASEVVTITQVARGTGGNTVIELTDTTAFPYLQNVLYGISKTDFTGGTGAALGFANELKSVLDLAVAAAIALPGMTVGAVQETKNYTDTTLNGRYGVKITQSESGVNGRTNIGGSLVSDRSTSPIFVNSVSEQGTTEFIGGGVLHVIVGVAGCSTRSCFMTQLKNAIESVNGHPNTITVTSDTSTAGDYHLLLTSPAGLKKYVGTADLNTKLMGVTLSSRFAKTVDNPQTRPEGWHIEKFLDISTGAAAHHYIINEDFAAATTVGTTDTRILNLPTDSVSGDPSPYEYWDRGGPGGALDKDGNNNKWTFLKGATPSAGTGPGGGAHTNSTYAYCEVTPEKVGQTFSLVTPLIDLLDVSSDTVLSVHLTYHMHGLHIGNLKVQVSQDSNFDPANTEDLAVRWYDSAGTSYFQSKVISGQQQASNSDAFRNAYLGANSYGNALNDYLGKRFYLRLLYTAGITHLGDCAVGDFKVYFSKDSIVKRNSFKLLNPTYDDHHRPSAIYTREEVAKRPVNIRNIHMTSTSKTTLDYGAPTTAGNYLDRYEYVSTTSPEANDPWFVKNAGSVYGLKTEHLALGSGSITEILSGSGDFRNIAAANWRKTLKFDDFELPDRKYITGSAKDASGIEVHAGQRNRTRFKSRFSAPGGFEVMSRGFLDVEHEIYSVYNAMPWRNNWARKVYNSQLQAHCGRFGVSSHTSSHARVYGSETPGAVVTSHSYISGDASKHKYHRNNVERLKLGALPDNLAASLNGSNQYFTVPDSDHFSFGDGDSDSPFSVSLWVKFDDFSGYQSLIDKGNEWYLRAYATTLEFQIKKYSSTQGTHTRTAANLDTLAGGAGSWVHIAVTYDGRGGSGAINGMKIYINGTLATMSGTSSGASNYDAMENQGTALGIGSLHSGADPLGGAIDEVSIWRTELSALDVMKLYTGAPYEDGQYTVSSTVTIRYDSAGPGELTRHPKYPNLEAWWRLGDAGDTVTDAGVITEAINKTNNKHKAISYNSPTTTAGPTPGRGALAVTSSIYDNAFISHTIPRTDNQLRWITGSII